MATGTNCSMDSLEQRISALESVVFGNAEKDADYPKNVKTKIPCIDSMLEIQGKMDTALTGKKRAALLFSKLSELKNYLDQSYTDGMLLSESAQIEMILAESEFIKEQAALLQKLAENQNNINSEHIHAVPKYSDKLQALSQIQIEQQDTVSNLNDESRKLLMTYNNIVSLLTKQFVLWDQTLTKLEMQASQKPA